jgi:exonuclease SbcD
MKVETITTGDWHIKDTNIKEIFNLVEQLCQLANKHEVEYVFVKGDVFESKVKQGQDVLTAFGKILDIFESYGVTLIAIAGNHDKGNYRLTESFLDPFKHYPNFQLFPNHGVIVGNNINFHILSYFSEEVYLEKLAEVKKKIDPSRLNFLMSHQELTGSANNDYHKIENSIKVSDFKEFDKVLLAHFHNESQIGDNIFHLPSIQQNNYGEDNRKGFTLVYEDGSLELVKSSFKEFKKVTIDLDKVELEDVDEYIKEYSKDPNNIKFEITGSEEKIKSLKKEKIIQNGIEVTTKIKEIDHNMKLAESNEVIEFTVDSIEDEFTEFCNDKKLNIDEGVHYLEKKLGKKFKLPCADEYRQPI